MGNIGSISSIGETNSDNTNKLYMENFSLVDNDLQLITTGVAFSSSQSQHFYDKKKYIAGYDTLSLSNDIALTSSTRDYNRDATTINCIYNGMEISVSTASKAIYFRNLATMEVNTITCDYIYNDVMVAPAADFYQIYPFKMDGVNYIGVFYVTRNNQITFLYRNINSTTTTAMFESKPFISKTIGSGAKQIYQDTITGKIYMINGNDFYEYNFVNNTYTLLKTLPALPSGSYTHSSAVYRNYVVHDSTLYLATDRAYVLTIGVNTGTTWNILCNTPETVTIDNTANRLKYSNNMFILACRTSQGINGYGLYTFNVNGVLTKYMSSDNIINLAPMIDPDACAACYTITDSPYKHLTLIYFTKIYNLTKNGITTKCLLKEDNTEEI